MSPLTCKINGQEFEIASVFTVRQCSGLRAWLILFWQFWPLLFRAIRLKDWALIRENHAGFELIFRNGYIIHLTPEEKRQFDDAKELLEQSLMLYGACVGQGLRT